MDEYEKLEVELKTIYEVNTYKISVCIKEEMELSLFLCLYAYLIV